MALKLLADAVGDLSDVEDALAPLKKLVAAAQAGTDAALTPAELQSIGKLASDIEGLVADAKTDL